MWDSLVYDQMTFEVVPNRKGQPAEWYAVDAATMRLADARSMATSYNDDTAVRYVQIYDSMIINEYTAEELCFGVRNPRTDIYLHGYGVSELEMLIQAVTALLYGFEYNTKFFSQGSAAKGILNFKGAIPEQSLQAFRRQWYAQISGVQNAWRTPIVNSEDLQWINMQGSNREMEYSAWMDFQIKTACAMFGMDPVELNFNYGNVGQRSTLSEASNKDKLTESKERGLRPLMRFLAKCINQYIIWPLHTDFEFRFVGLDSMTREDRADLNTKRVKTLWTINELRAEDDRPPLPDGKGDVILDSVWLQAMQTMQGQQPGGGGPPGPEGAPGGEETPPEGEEKKKKGKGDEMDFESALANYAEENPEGEEEEERGPEKGGMGIRGPGSSQGPTQKSLRIWRVEL
jgi:phage portal protein BeeE